MEIKPINCVNCGAPINLETLKCEYCGTGYEVRDETVTVFNELGMTNILTPNELRKALGMKPIK